MSNELDFLGLGEDLNEMAVDAGGFRRVQHMNPNYTYHKGTLIQDGGYAIKNEMGDAPALKGGMFGSWETRPSRNWLYPVTNA